VIQSFLIVFCWIALAVNALATRRNQSPSRKESLSEWRKLLVDAISGFQAAQCYFSIPLAIAAYFSGPFNLDPLNAFGLLPVSTNGFMPEIFTLMIMNYHESWHWYPLLLTYISYILNSVVFWAVIKYLTGVEKHGRALPRAAFESLGHIDSCGGTTGLALCLQFQPDSPPAWLIQKHFSTANVRVKLAEGVWSWCTMCLLVLTYFQFQARGLLKNKVKAPFSASVKGSRLRSFQNWSRRSLGSPVWYYAASFIFFNGLLYQATLFYSFLGLGLVDLRTVSFGQIVAISVWVPPVVDYLHAQFGHKIEEMCTPRIHDDSPDLRQPLSPVNTIHRATNRGYAQAADDDDEDIEGQMPHRNRYAHFAESRVELSANITHPNEFQLKSRGTRDFEDTRYDY
jgi:hypothetical protein